eukprot:TRINITY_DN20811_c0_g1_i1.p1 TRINITY_DN20811_c0_g1~~TRINITY_DN20811_c0_g1_i1.p1  ORF type:complete len:113 (-),score=22.66 TRINITY_DN20811_c0_g1_i1:556-894(-)
MGLFGKRKSSEKQSEAATDPPPAAARVEAPPEKPSVSGAAGVGATIPPEPKVKSDQDTVQQDTSVFEFGSAGNSEEKITLAGYCPISDEMEPCRWEILPSGGSEAPQFRIIF